MTAAGSLVLLGSTGSIGTQTLDVLQRLRGTSHDREVAGLSAGRNVERLIEQIEACCPEAVSIGSPDDASRIAQVYPDLTVYSGPDGPTMLVEHCEACLVVNALVGAAGLPPTLEAIRGGAVVALANKESLVIGGDLVQEALARHGGRILPIDSEHNAVFQCLEAGRRCDVERLILTASGGPFLRVDPEAFPDVTPEDALRHPNWSMGARITIDSATMVNKAFEVIEAHYLFGLPLERIDVPRPPGVHGSLLRGIQGRVDPRGTGGVRYADSDSVRVDVSGPSGVRPPRLATDSPFVLEFEPLDEMRYPAFSTILAAARLAGSAMAAVNAADEVLIDRFLRREIRFTAIASGLERVLREWEERFADEPRPDLGGLRAVDRWGAAARRNPRALRLLG